MKKNPTLDFNLSDALLTLHHLFQAGLTETSFLNGNHYEFSKWGWTTQTSDGFCTHSSWALEWIDVSKHGYYMTLVIIAQWRILPGAFIDEDLTYVKVLGTYWYVQICDYISPKQDKLTNSGCHLNWNFGTALALYWVGSWMYTIKEVLQHALGAC